MSCCGKKREVWRGEAQRTPLMPANRAPAVYFRYVGNSALTVVGPVTGRVYTFSGRGAAAAADPRDAPSIAAVPLLVQVSKL
jgi:hypothetical protein